MTYELHPLCTLFPRLTGAEFDALREDIKANGLRQPIVLHEGMILDGGNRYRACAEAGVEPVFVEFGGGNLVSFVLSANLHRRHMSAGQQAAIVASAQDWAKAQKRGGDRRSDQSQAVDFETVDQRAAAAGVSRVTQMKADKVAKADPELAKKVAHGEVSLPKAVEQIAPPKKAPRPAPVVEEPAEDFGPSEDEIRQAQQGIEEELESLRRVADADDRVAAALAEAKRYREMNRMLTERINGLLNERNEQIRMIKALQRKLQAQEAA